MEEPLRGGGTLARSAVVVLTGTRQTGKTMLVCDQIGQGRRYLTLMRNGADRSRGALPIPLGVRKVVPIYRATSEE